MPNFTYGQKELDYLKKKDKKLGLVIDRIGMIEREVIPDLFTALIYSVISQQISAKAATTVWTRLQQRLGEITPETIATTPVGEIQQCGLSFRKSSYIQGIGTTILKGELDLDALVSLPEDDVIRQLSSLRGVGKWTAEMLLIFSMERKDIVSFDDLAIQRGMKAVYQLNDLSREQFDRYRNRYSPYGTVASLYLWAASHEQTMKKE